MDMVWFCQVTERSRTERRAAAGKREVKMAAGDQSVIGYRLLVISYRLSVIGYRLSGIGYRASVIG
jgi:hypothetical protein